MRILLLLFVALIALGIYAYRHNNTTPKPTSTAPTSQQPQPPALQQPIDTANGKRYASVQTAADLKKAATLDQATKALQTFMDQYGVTVQTASVTPSDYVKQNDTFVPLDDKDVTQLKSYGALFIDEWAKYPHDWVSKSGLKYVVITKDLAIKGQQRAATPDPDGSAMYYDIGYQGDTYNREVIHHEYDHFVEYADFNHDYAHQDNAWTTQNPAGFAYKPGGGASAYTDANFVNTQHPSDSFVDYYATYAIEEDKAETLAYLMTDTYYHQLTGWIKTDSKLAQKVALYKQFVTSISPEMSGDYFDSINP
jgi:hypothetical protein